MISRPKSKEDFIEAIGTVYAGGAPGSVTASAVRSLLNEFAEKVWESERLHVPAEYFGCVAVSHPEANLQIPVEPVDNRLQIQTAIEWSAATGGVVEFGYGVYGFEGVLIPKSHMSIVGQGKYQTILAQMSPNESCIDTRFRSGYSRGVSHCTIRDITIDGRWNKCAPRSNVGFWQYNFEEMSAVGISLDGPQDNDESKSLNWYGTPDTFHKVENVQVKNIGGNAFLFGGRGEMMLRGLRASTYANDGIVMESPDNWMSDVSVHVGGRNGVVCGYSNQRWTDVKAWFIGMSRKVEPEGFGFKFTGRSMTQSVFHGLTTQDTYGPGMQLRGKAIYLTGSIDEAAGGRLSQQGLGFTLDRNSQPSCIDLSEITDSNIVLTVTGSNRNNNYPLLAAITSVNCDNNTLNIIYNKIPDPWYEPENPVSIISGNIAAKRHNVIRSHDGILLSGARKLEDVYDAEHSVNIRKGFGFSVVLEDGRIITKMGSLPESEWVNAMGDVVVTPR